MTAKSPPKPKLTDAERHKRFKDNGNLNYLASRSGEQK